MRYGIARKRSVYIDCEIHRFAAFSAGKDDEAQKDRSQQFHRRVKKIFHVNYKLRNIFSMLRMGISPMKMPYVREDFKSLRTFYRNTRHTRRW